MNITQARKVVARVKLGVGTDSTRSNLTAIHIVLNGKLVIESTDSHRLIRYSLDEYKAKDGGEHSFMVTPKSLDLALKGLKSWYQFALGLDGDRPTVNGKPLDLVEGKYPPCDQVIPRGWLTLPAFSFTTAMGKACDSMARAGMSRVVIEANKDTMRFSANQDGMEMSYTAAYDPRDDARVNGWKAAFNPRYLADAVDGFGSVIPVHVPKEGDRIGPWMFGVKEAFYLLMPMRLN